MKKLLLLLFFIYGPVSASDFAPSCLIDFDVKDKAIDMDNQTVSCRLLEQSRVTAFQRIEALTGKNDEDILVAMNELKSFRKKLVAAEKSSNWGFATSTIVGNFIGSVGLLGCAETLGIGCAVGAAGFAWAKYETIRSATEESKRKEASRELIGMIDRLEKKVTNMQIQINLKNEATSSFNQMCQTIKKSCL
jgi:hypothetical protein